MPEGKMLWSYRAVFKQTAGGGGTVLMNIIAAERTEIIYGVTGPNDYAANRTLTAVVNDVDGAKVFGMMFNASVDNAQLTFPINDLSVVATNDGPELEKRVVIGVGESVQVFAAALAQNEELTVNVRAFISTTKPTITTTGSGGTVTTTTTYDKVI